MREVERRAVLTGHNAKVHSLAWSPDGRLLASASQDRTVRLWDVETGACVRENLGGGISPVGIVVFDRLGARVATANSRGDATVWDVGSGRLLSRVTLPASSLALGGDADWLVVGGLAGLTVWDLTTREPVLVAPGAVNGVALSRDGGRVAAAGASGVIQLWDGGRSSPLVVGEHAGTATTVVFGENERTLFSAGADAAINVWAIDDHEARLIRTLEGHPGAIRNLLHVSRRQVLVSRGFDGTFAAWDAASGDQLLLLDGSELGGPGGQLAIHPTEPLIATVYGATNEILVWELEHERLLGGRTAPSVSYASARVVLVGDSGVGKTGLGWRLVHGNFREHAGTHGQQFWLLEQLKRTRADGTECETVLWDLAGQPDYRLIHTLFLDDVDVALLLFDPTRFDDPLPAVEFWLRHFAAASTRLVLVAGRTDLGTSRLPRAEIDAFCRRWGIDRYVETSARSGEGLEELTGAIAAAIPWDAMPATVTTDGFKRIKDHVLALKERASSAELIIPPEELRVDGHDAAEVESVAGHLSTHGYVATLTTSAGERRLLLAPELLNNLAASLILEARRDPKELGSLDEEQLRAGGYTLPELTELPRSDRELLVDSTIASFLVRNVCFRETDPITRRTFLVFPELMVLQRSEADDPEVLDETIWYTATGAVKNVYASLVVLMGYTGMFPRGERWRDHARYVVGDGQVCGFRVHELAAGELEFGLQFARGVPEQMRLLFQGLFESFLTRPELGVTRLPVPACEEGHLLGRETARRRLANDFDHGFCGDCGKRVTLKQPAVLTGAPQTIELSTARTTVTQRARFEEARFRLQSHVADAALHAPSTFISYAWGVARQESQVARLAADLADAAIPLIFDRWDAEPASSRPRFVERVAIADKVIVIGTPDYLRKYLNHDPMGGFVVAAEGDLIGHRLTGSEDEKASIVPLLFAGAASESFPPLLQTRLHIDFRVEGEYFRSLLRLLLHLYGISPRSAPYTPLQAILAEP